MLRNILRRPFAALMPRRAADIMAANATLELADAKQVRAEVERLRREMAVEMLPPAEAIKQLSFLEKRFAVRLAPLQRKDSALAIPHAEVKAKIEYWENLQEKDGKNPSSEVINPLRSLEKLYSSRGAPLQRKEYALLSLQALFTGARLTIHLLNNKDFGVAVPFEKASGLPSLPSMAADAGNCARLIGTLSGEERGLLTSFTGWAPFMDYQEECCCEKNFFIGKMRTLHNTLFLRNIAENRGQTIRLRQYVGVRSATDMEHLYEHYSPPSAYGYGNTDKEQLTEEIRAVIGEKKIVILYGAESVVDMSGSTPRVSVEKYFLQRLFLFSSFMEVMRDAAENIKLIGGDDVFDKKE